MEVRLGGEVVAGNCLWISVMIDTTLDLALARVGGFPP
jgi:hypothetical protein